MDIIVTGSCKRRPSVLGRGRRTFLVVLEDTLPSTLPLKSFWLKNYVGWELLSWVMMNILLLRFVLSSFCLSLTFIHGVLAFKLVYFLAIGLLMFPGFAGSEAYAD